MVRIGLYKKALNLDNQCFLFSHLYSFAFKCNWILWRSITDMLYSH